MLARNSVLSSFVILFVVASAAPARAQTLRSTLVAGGLDQPIGLTSPPGDVHRLFVVGRTGTIRIIRDGVLLPTPFLDIQSEVSTYGEGGLLGLAFHPDYANNERFFVSFIGGLRENPILREYRASVNPDVADPATRVDLLEQFPYYAHAHVEYGGDLHFGPDGMLYFSLGDNGYTDVAQRLSQYNGKMLRLDVDVPAPYVPADNPYASPNDSGLDLMWARGLRNPWRFSFDRLTGDMYIGDVGEGSREEIDVQPANHGAPGSPTYEGGRNYGWPCMEGTMCTGFLPHHCSCDPSGATLVLPAYEALHNSQQLAIIGGFVYRGSAIPGLQGQYFCADYMQNTVTTFELVNGHARRIQDRTAELRAGVPGGIRALASFGEDAGGELYWCDMVDGTVHRIDPVASACSAPAAYCSTAPNSVGSGATMDSAGSASIAAAELVLFARGAPHGATGTFWCGTQQVQVPYGNGWSCVGGSVIHLPVVQTDDLGIAVLPLDAARISATAGQTRNFQFLYRDPAAGGQGFNASDGRSVVFCP